MKITFKYVKEQLEGTTVSVSKRDGEFLVRVKGSPKGHGYHTNDLVDALSTGRHMHEEEINRRHQAAVQGGLHR